MRGEEGRGEEERGRRGEKGRGEEGRGEERREKERRGTMQAMTTFCVVAADLSPSGGFLKAFGDKGEHNAGKDEDNNEHHTHQDRILTHCCVNDPITIHVCVYV